MRGALMPVTPASTEATTTANNEPGSARWRRTAPTMIAATSSTSSSDDQLPSPRNASPTARTATAAVFWPSGFGTPRAVGTCCKKMMRAIPMVKPSTTGHGM